MGTMTAVSANIAQEAVHRAICINTQVKRLRRHVLCNSSIQLATKKTVIQSYVLSTGLFQAGAWPELPKSQYTRLHHAIMGAYRMASAANWSATAPQVDMKSDQQVIQDHDFIAPAVMLRLLRLCLFVRVLQKAPPYLLHLIALTDVSATSWISVVRKDLEWLTREASFADCVDWTLSQWSEAIVARPNFYYKKRFCDFCNSPEANALLNWAKKAQVRDFGVAHSCAICSRNFHARQALAVHNLKMHGLKRKERLLVATTHCTICMTEFWTRERVVAHIAEKSKICRINLSMHGPVLSEQEADELDRRELEQNIRPNAHLGHRRHHVTVPCLRLPGPLINIVPLQEYELKETYHPLGNGRRWLNTNLA